MLIISFEIFSISTQNDNEWQLLFNLEICFSKAIIGVNNRDLKTFEVDINNSINLKKVFKGDNIFVAESGIKSQKDIKHLREHNINVFLIGESLMNGDFFAA